MFNVTILKGKDIIRYFIYFVLFIILILIGSEFLGNKNNLENIKDSKENKIKQFLEGNMQQYIGQTIKPVSSINSDYIENNNIDNDKKTEDKSFFQEILKTQISSIKGMEILEKNKIEADKDENNEENIEDGNKETNGDVESGVELAGVGMKTEVITNKPISQSYNAEYGKVKIKNQTDYELTEEMLKPNIEFGNRRVLLFHTHSCESYTSSDKYSYTPTGTFRTTDLNYTVTKVGTELESHLKRYNYDVIHNTDYHDYPAYNGSYTRSLNTVENILNNTPSDIVIDIHRDAIGSRSDYAPSVKIGDTDIAAQIMFVIGTNDGGLWHPNWNQNLKFAVKIQEKAEELYPGLFKPIMLTKSRYNQHTAKYASIIEVGATGNTLEQCLTSMKYLSKVIDEVMK